MRQKQLISKTKVKIIRGLSIRKRAEESKVNVKGETDEKISPQIDITENKRITDGMTNRSEPEMSPIKSNEKLVDTPNVQILPQTPQQTSEANITASLHTSSVMLLQTQVSVSTDYTMLGISQHLLDVKNAIPVKLSPKP